MGQLGRGKGNDGICAVRVRCEEVSRVRLPARREIHRDHRRLRIALEQLAAGDREATHRGTKAGPQHSVDKELRTLQQSLAIITVQVRPLP